MRMLVILFKSLSTAAISIFGVITVLFFLFYWIGDPAQMLAGQRNDLATLESIRAELGLDKPLLSQYSNLLNDISPVALLDSKQQSSGNYHFLNIISTEPALVLKWPYLRRSFQSNRPVIDLYLSRLPGTLILATVSLILAIFIGIPLGGIAAANAQKTLDKLLIIITTAGIAAPSFFMAVLLIRIFVIDLGGITNLPIAGYLIERDIFSADTHIDFRYLVLPALSLAIRPLSQILQLTRDACLGVLDQNYIRTARAKGLSEGYIWFKHILPNALNPLITATSGWFASLLSGAFFIEYLFDWLGVGKLTVDAMLQYDFPVILGGVVMSATIFITVNTFADILNRLIDPRIS